MLTYTKPQVVDFFRDQLAKHGDSPASLEWSPPGQLIRFETCLRTLPAGTYWSVLDLGCGLGHFADGLPNEVDYLGLDACPEMIAVAQQRAPHRRFEVADILMPFPHRADLVVANGVLNLETDTNRNDMDVLLSLAFAAARKAAVVTMLSTHTADPKPGRHYYAPHVVLASALQLTPKVLLNHAYFPHDFAVRMFR